MNTTTLTAPASRAQVPNLSAMALRAISAIFSPNASLIAACIVAALMYFHFMTIADTVAAQRAIATDCLYLSPWGIAWLLRITRRQLAQKGGTK